MDQNKSSKFISKLRKEKNMTQEQLAEKMGVSINAVSKWERGLSFPDVSLYKKLCKELDINIEELINGEKNNSGEDKEKTIIFAKNKTKKNTKKLIIILSIIFIIILCTLIYYNINLKINLVDDSDNLYVIAIDYLRDEEFKTNPDSSRDDFNVFYSYHGFGIEKKNGYKYVYMWIFSQSYYLEEKEALAMAGGNSTPYKFTFKNDEVINVEVPKDGNEYASSIKKIFPSIIANQVLNYDKEENINKLFNEVLDKKNKYYDYLTFDMKRITIDDISYGDLIFTVWIANKDCVQVELAVYKNNYYKLFNEYEACKPNTLCTSILKYTNSIDGKYDYDIIQIIKHSTDANNLQNTNDISSKYEIYGGNGYMFITDNDNKYLTDFLKSIDVDLTKCAKANYDN
jgi:transcriptional regulator with XRE-family HTH domain